MHENTALARIALLIAINFLIDTLCRVKNASERSSAKTSKYLLMKKNRNHVLNSHILGENKGEVKSIMRIPGDSSTLVISTSKGDYLELQV